MHKKITKLSLTALILLVSGCAILYKQAPEKIVAEKAAQRWDALIANNIALAYSFETPEYRSVYSIEQYKKRVYGVGTWQKANVQSVNCKAEKCIVKILIDAKIKFGSGFGSAETSSVLKEQWIQSLAAEGWYHFSNQ